MALGGMWPTAAWLPNFMLSWLSILVASRVQPYEIGQALNLGEFALVHRWISAFRCSQQ